MQLVPVSKNGEGCGPVSGDDFRDWQWDALQKTPRPCELLMEFPCPIKSLLNIDGRLFATLETGQTVEVTELIGEAKH